MKRLYVIFFILLLVINLNACSSKDANFVFSEDLIISNLNDIKTLQITREQENTNLITDKDKISKIYNLLKGLNMEVMSEKKENILMQNNVLSVSLVFMSKDKIVGSIMIFSTGDVIIHDLNNAFTNKRTVSYIHYQIDNGRFQEILFNID